MTQVRCPACRAATEVILRPVGSFVTINCRECGDKFTARRAYANPSRGITRAIPKERGNADQSGQ